jgi:hypothetical protein
MRKSGVTSTSAMPVPKISTDSAKAKFFYQGLFLLKRLQLNSKSKTPNKSVPDTRKR